MDEKILAECQIFLKKLGNAYAARDVEWVAELFFDFYRQNSFFSEHGCHLIGSSIKDCFVISMHCGRTIYYVDADCAEKNVIKPE